MKSRLAILAVLIAVLSGPAPAVSAAPAWTPAGEATIHPGVPTLVGDAICTANFVFYDSDANVYLGLAAHCAGLVDPTALDGCENVSLPVGTEVRVGGASRQATLVYNSWITMQERGETDPNVCLNNDFALIRLDPADNHRVNPSVPFWGGPVGIVSSSTRGADAFGFGTDISSRGLTSHPTDGVSLAQQEDGWVHILDLDPPGIAGDSGSGILDGQGRAFGVLSTYAPRSGLNGAGDLSRQFDYARSAGFPTLQMANGTVPFTGTRAPRGTGNLVGDLLAAVLSLLGG